MQLLNVLVGSNNPGKLAEFADLLRDITGNLFQPKQLGLEVAIEETGASYAENARIKVQAFSQAAPDLLVIADDSGLELAAFGGWPGLHTVRWAGPDADDARRR